MKEKTLFDRLMEAQSQIVMLKETASAIFRGNMEEEITNVWFDGARINLEQVENLMCDILEIDKHRLNALEKKAFEEAQSEV